MKDFCQYCSIEHADISVLHSEKIKQRQAPEDVIQEVNEFLEEIMDLQLKESQEATYESNKNFKPTAMK